MPPSNTSKGCVIITRSELLQNSVVGHVLGGGGEFGVALDNLQQDLATRHHVTMGQHHVTWAK